MSDVRERTTEWQALEDIPVRDVPPLCHLFRYPPGTLIPAGAVALCGRVKRRTDATPSRAVSVLPRVCLACLARDRS